MALYRHNSESLPERRDFYGAVIRSCDRNENGLRFRRGRKFGRVTKRRLSAWTFLLALMSLIYFSVFGMKLPFHGWQDFGANISISNFLDENPVEPFISIESNHLLPGNNQNTIGGSHYRLGLEVPNKQKSKHRKQHIPCEVGFVESVDDIVEPKDAMNFTQFSIGYVNKEEKLYGHDTYEPRFGGHQTLKERENSFYARNQTLHCGFVKGPKGSPSTGFDVHENDRKYMSTCRIVVSSCIFGSSDFLRRPTKKKISEYSQKNVCFAMFMDELTMTKLSLEGHVADDDGYIGLWKIVVVRNLPYRDMRKTGKVPKFLSHRLFPSARYSIWIDSKMRLNTDPMLILEYFLWRKGAEYAISNHYDRHCVWEEVLQNKRLNKYKHRAIDEQFQFYQSDGLTKFNASDESTPLPSYVPEGSFIVRVHTPMSNLFSCLWFNEVDRFTSRDQLSFAYTFLKLRRTNPGRPFVLNMFKDCERRALVKLFHHRADEQPPPASL